MTEPGIHAIPADEYHADNIADTPTLSATIATTLCAQTPAHAWANHPKLNPNYEREEKPHYDLGTIVHQLLLEGHTNSLVAIDADNYRTNAAKEERDAAYAAGLTPILVRELPRVQAMVDAVTDRLAGHEADPPLFSDGLAERTLVWEEAGGVVCRARLDWLRDDRAAIDDLKTTGRSADPEACSRMLFGLGYDVRASFYLRGLAAVVGPVVAGMAEFRWCFIETEPPYALSVVSPGPDVLAVGDAKVEYAINRWRECLKADVWPGYPTRVCYAELPAWEEARWLAKEIREDESERRRAA